MFIKIIRYMRKIPTPGNDAWVKLIVDVKRKIELFPNSNFFF